MGKYFRSKTDLYRFLKSFAKEYSLNVDFDLNKNMDVGSGFTNENVNPRVVNIGIKQINGLKWYKSVSDLGSVLCLVSLNHEFHHVTQANLDSSGNSPMDLLLSSVSYNSSNYMLYMNNYENNIREIQAEKNGVFLTLNVLNTLFPEHKDYNEKMIVDYVNFKMQYDYVMHNEKIESVADIEDAFERGFNRAKETPHVYKMCPYQNTRDTIMLGMDIIHWHTEWQDIFDKFMNAKDGYESDLMAGSIMVYFSPDLYDQYPGLKDIDLSPETVFGMPFPESQDEVVERVKRRKLKPYSHSFVNNENEIDVIARRNMRANNIVIPVADDTVNQMQI